MSKLWSPKGSKFQENQFRKLLRPKGLEMDGVPYRAEIEQNLIKIEQINRVGKKTEKTLSNVCSSYQSHCAKWCGRVFKNEFLRHAHTTYHVTALLQTPERKNNGFASLKNHCRVKYTCDPLGVQPQDPKI
ncbi:hypothetical protein L6466_13060 [Prevotella communis]|uniref:hypothetical protein n=1 Tax=Prevotella communis TaxID=2913614 RepID=UPI001EDC2B34|nr:hypothetical protein [Prevotella communis]UKK67628.1 hypothetical protein L6464_13605 [Prevotella communis]UKK70225.1 hypothetical protein L6466_13060 [Prevotella communis]